MKFSHLSLIICGAETLKLKSLKVRQLTTFFKTDFTSVHSSFDRFDRPVAFQRTACWAMELAFPN